MSHIHVKQVIPKHGLFTVSLVIKVALTAELVRGIGVAIIVNF